MMRFILYTFIALICKDIQLINCAEVAKFDISPKTIRTGDAIMINCTYKTEANETLDLMTISKDGNEFYSYNKSAAETNGTVKSIAGIQQQEVHIMGIGVMHVMKADNNTAGNYTCSYNATKKDSQNVNNVTFTVAFNDNGEAKFEISPNKIKAGDNISISCTYKAGVNETLEIMTISKDGEQFYAYNKSIQYNTTDVNGTAKSITGIKDFHIMGIGMMHVMNVDKNTTGKYICSYNATTKADPNVGNQSLTVTFGDAVTLGVNCIIMLICAIISQIL